MQEFNSLSKVVQAGQFVIETHRAEDAQKLGVLTSDQNFYLLEIGSGQSVATAGK